MRKCPWCKYKATVKNSPLGYYAECERNGHIHNIGVLVSASKSFKKTKQEAEELWNKEVEKYRNKNTNQNLKLKT
ncbi:MAG: hypothetical protein IJN92_10060 [Lachnospiraceae bacterium]|nr:hypothetical protein [Lachnospiraceae bacterium]